jgi:hypothetical protein
MLRTARNGIILIEPQESGFRILNLIKMMIKLVLRGDNSFDFEPTGNFIFRVNLKEIRKMMTSLNLSVIAYKKFNDFYHPKLTPKSSKGFSIAKYITSAGIGFQNFLCKVGLMDYGLATVIIFKQDIGSNKLRQLKKDGFTICKLPVNPYIN